MLRLLPLQSWSWETALHEVPSLHPASSHRCCAACRPVAAAQASESQTKADVSGKWKKDKSRSDSMQEACDVVKLNYILRKGLKIVNTLEVRAALQHRLSLYMLT